VLDIATSERAIGYVGLAKLAQESIPETWGIDEQGKPTTDPAQVRAMKPFGGYKGYALSAAFEILSGALVRVGIGQEGNLASRGALILLLDPTIFGHTMTSFSQQVTRFLEEMKSVTPAGSLQVSYPGELSEQRYRQHLEAGEIWLPDEVIKELEAVPSAI
jgi:LDH2 family malate/lactate/ureidoglycolate dehydrogenase